MVHLVNIWRLLKRFFNTSNVSFFGLLGKKILMRFMMIHEKETNRMAWSLNWFFFMSGNFHMSECWTKILRSIKFSAIFDIVIIKIRIGMEFVRRLKYLLYKISFLKAECYFPNQFYGNKKYKWANLSLQIKFSAELKNYFILLKW